MIIPIAISSRNGHSSPIRLAARIAELVLAVVIAWVAAQAFWFAIYGTAAMDLSIETPDLSPPAASQGRIERASPAASLFDAIQRAETQAAPAPPETRLNLVLRGVRAANDPSSGSAVIESPSAGQRALAAGSEIAAGVRLVEIYEDRVIIDRRGARETVYLREEGRRADRAGVDRAQAAAAGDPEPAAAPALSSQDWMEGLSLEPALSDGRMTGLRVRPASRLEVLRAAGLQHGDIILTVNGAALDGLGAARAVADTFETAAQLRLEIQRDGAPVTLTIPLEHDG